MPIDANILLQRQPVQLSNPLAQAGQIAQIQGAQQQNRLAQLQFDQAQHGVDQESKLNSLYQGKDVLNPDGTINRTALYSGAAQSGLGSKIPLLQKNFSDADKSAADAKSAQLKNIKDFNGLLGSASYALTQNPSYEGAVSMLTQLKGIAPPEIASHLDISTIPRDPAELLAWAQKGYQTSLDTDKVLAAKTSVDTNAATNATSRLNNQETNATSRANNNATVGATIRGQNMSDKRAQQQLEQGKVPSGYRQNPDGSLSAIPGGPADPNIKANKTPTEGERKAATLLQRLEGSQMQLNQALKENPSATKPGLLQNGLQSIGMESTANSMSSSERQRVEAAQLDILDAALTLGTGAAYTKEQLQGYQKSYFPQIGDKPDTIRDKQARLNNVINAGKIAAGNALGKVDTSASTPAAGNDGWSVREVK